MGVSSSIIDQLELKLDAEYTFLSRKQSLDTSFSSSDPLPFPRYDPHHDSSHTHSKPKHSQVFNPHSKSKHDIRHAIESSTDRWYSHLDPDHIMKSFVHQYHIVHDEHECDSESELSESESSESKHHKHKSFIMIPKCSMDPQSSISPLICPKNRICCYLPITFAQLSVMPHCLVSHCVALQHMQEFFSDLNTNVMSQLCADQRNNPWIKWISMRWTTDAPKFTFRSEADRNHHLTSKQPMTCQQQYGVLRPVIAEMEQRTLKEKDNIIFLTHQGPSSSCTTSSYNDKRSKYICAGSDYLDNVLHRFQTELRYSSFSPSLSSFQTRLVGCFHGHSHDGSFLGRCGSIPCINPGAVKDGQCALCTFEKDEDGKWGISMLERLDCI
eukprot:gnl/Carplike_NY0171/10858_a15396_124.p1 GENE.gnl/Carplike_NY0171/10858_a15396_124~~gnl/Carplike_NY0171/10858_a15396_124.p1  ORF type:complete len:384 (+),score=32.24 gnl/Carplike_NY0171/10858_a15396_124:1-1152(+)